MSNDTEYFRAADLSWQGDIPASNEYGDVYFSLVDGLKESQYVFIEANELSKRLTSEHPPRLPFIVAEAGFGTGLNFLLSWKGWQAISPAQRRPLHFISFEKHPLSLADLQNALAKWPELSQLASQLTEQYPLIIRGQHTLRFEAKQVVLTLVFGDINDTLAGYHFQADCWFLDGFSPNKNPEMWSTALLQRIARLSGQGASFSTFAAASSVRRGLESAGFAVRRIKGYGKKREMLLGTLQECAKPAQPELPALSKLNWSRPAPGKGSLACKQLKPAPSDDQHFDAIVIGAGLAGTSTAHELCNRGLRVAILDECSQAVMGASGQSQLVMYAKLPSERNKVFNFVAHCLAHSLQYYRTLQRSRPRQEFWHPCGLLQLAWNAKEVEKQSRFAQNIQMPKDFVRTIEASEASEKSGIEHDCGGLWFEQAGWLDPKAYSEALLNAELVSSTPAIKAFYDTEALSFSQSADSTWRVETQTQILKSTYLVVANSNDAKRFPLLAHLPSKALRGQVTSIKTPADTDDIAAAKCVLTGEGYLCPPVAAWHHFGATFDLDCVDTVVKPLDNEKNFKAMQKWNPNWLTANNEASHQLQDYMVRGKAGLRCTTPDYLPIVGQAPIYDKMLETFSSLRVGANNCKALYGHYYSGLFVNIGHGSKGAFTTPVAAELIANEICGGLLPVNESLKSMLSPARFIIKHLKQRRI